MLRSKPLKQRYTKYQKVQNRKSSLAWVIGALMIGIMIGSSSSILKSLTQPTNSNPAPFIAPASEVSISENIELCFTPPRGCTAVIVKAINEATESIYVQAYGITSPVIVDALIDANRRGLEVRILLDKSNIKSKWSKMKQLVKAGIDVNIDKVTGIAHNKVMILDQEKVITGSFNFTRAANIKNAENVLIIKDKQIADSYMQNWLKRKAANEKDKK